MMCVLGVLAISRLIDWIYWIFDTVKSTPEDMGVFYACLKSLSENGHRDGGWQQQWWRLIILQLIKDHMNDMPCLMCFSIKNQHNNLHHLYCMKHILFGGGVLPGRRTWLSGCRLNSEKNTKATQICKVSSSQRLSSERIHISNVSFVVWWPFCVFVCVWLVYGAWRLFTFLIVSNQFTWFHSGHVHRTWNTLIHTHKFIYLFVFINIFWAFCMPHWMNRSRLALKPQPVQCLFGNKCFVKSNYWSLYFMDFAGSLFVWHSLLSINPTVCVSFCSRVCICVFLFNPLMMTQS